MVDAWRSAGRSVARHDILAGLTVGALLVPQSMALAGIAGLPPVVGLYASFLPLIAYALVGSSRQVVMGPTATIMLMVAAAIVPMGHHDPARLLALSGLLALMVGGVCIAAGVLRLGFVTAFLSNPVLKGFVAGAALNLAATQLGKLVRVKSTGDTFIRTIVDLVPKLDRVHWLTLAVGAGSLALLLVLRHFAPRVPGALVVVVFATAASALFDLSGHGLRVAGEIPRGLPGFRVPDVNRADLRSLLPNALAIALVAYVETIAVAKAMATRFGYEVDPNRELIALGATHAVAGLSQGIAMDASFSRTAVAAESGARTQVAGIVAAAVVGFTLIFLTPLFKDLPDAALAGIVLAAVISLLDVPTFIRLWRVRREDFVTAVAAFVGTVTFGVLPGVAIAVLISLSLVVLRTARPHRAVLGYVPENGTWRDASRWPTAHGAPGVVVLRFDAPLFFANAEQLRDDVLRLVRQSPVPVHGVVLDASAVNFVDSTGADLLLALDADLAGQGVQLVLARANGSTRDVLERAGFAGWHDPVRYYPSVAAAVAAVGASGEDPRETDDDH